MTKPTLILVPGLTFDAALWRAQVEGLSDIADIRVADHSLDDTMEAIAKRILDDAPERFAIAGMSMGGYAALEVCAQAAERVTHLGLLGTHARAGTKEAKDKRLEQIAAVEAGGYPAWLDGFEKLMGVPAAVPMPVVREMSLRAGPEVFVRQQKAIMTAREMRPELSRFRMPSFVIAGKRDQLIPVEFMTEMADMLPRADLHLLANCGHCAPIERPRLVTAIMRIWLQR